MRVVDLLDLAADRLAVGDLRLADVGLDVELALHAVDEDVEVQLAHAGDDGLPGLVVGVHLEGRVFLGEPLDRDAELLLVDLRLGLDGHRDDRRREGHRLEDHRLAGIAGVSPVVVCFSPATATIEPAPADAMSSCLFACMRSRRPMRSLRSLVELSSAAPVVRVPE